MFKINKKMKTGPEEVEVFVHFFILRRITNWNVKLSSHQSHYYKKKQRAHRNISKRK